MEVIGRTIPEEVVDELVAKIKEKKEISGIDNQLVRDQVEKECSKDAKLLDLLLLGKKAPQRQLLKRVRAELHRVHGSFNDDAKKRKQLLKTYVETKNEDVLIELLKTHTSTAERLDIYESLYHNIFDLTEKPTSILDLGCGINPLSLIFSKLESIEYVASDISSDDLALVHKFFSLHEEYAGSTLLLNLFNAKKGNIFLGVQPVDICFLFKVFDVIEQSESHKISENIILTVPANWVIVSFPTRTVSGKKMRYPRRGWIEQMLKRLELSYEVLSYSNEIFYIINKLQKTEKDKAKKEQKPLKKDIKKPDSSTKNQTKKAPNIANIFKT
jgi:16S rRNA (guanine(1405)-N(7))-methyltransferase